jgi:hypothetical protein
MIALARVKVMARRLDDLCFSKLRVCDVTIPLCVESPTSSANPSLIQNIVAIGRRRAAS